MARPEVIQVQFRPEEAERIRANAEMMGLSQSAYVRRLVLPKLLIPAWWAQPFDGPQMTVRAMRSNGVARMHGPPDFHLELLYEAEDGGASYRVFDRQGHAFTFAALRAHELVFRELERGRVLMGGSHVLWRIVRSVEDLHLAGQLHWLLSADRREDSEPLNLPD